LDLGAVIPGGGSGAPRLEGGISGVVGASIKRLRSRGRNSAIEDLAVRNNSFPMAALSRFPSRLMASSKSQVASQRLASLNRQFSSPPSKAFEVKKLGVIGAGQMVCRTVQMVSFKADRS
jgi:hypothetical protein